MRSKRAHTEKAVIVSVAARDGHAPPLLVWLPSMCIVAWWGYPLARPALDFVAKHGVAALVSGGAVAGQEQAREFGALALLGAVTGAALMLN